MKEKLKQLAIEFTIVGLIMGGWYACHRRDKKIDQSILAPTLPPGDQAHISIDPKRHEIIVTTPGHLVKRFLPPTGGSVDLRKGGDVVITTRSWGTETNPYVGGAFGSDISLRAALGLNLFYVQRWEAGPGLLITSNVRDARVYLGITYNAYNEWVLGAAVDNRKTVHIIAGLRF